MEVEGEHGTLVLTDASAEVLRGEREVRLRKDAAPAKAEGGGRAERSGRGAGKSAAAAADLPEEAKPLFEALRAWRGEQAREQGVPAYVVFHDATLREIATQRPGTLGELGGIGGVGEKKLANYGEGILEVLAGPSGPEPEQEPEPDPEQEPEPEPELAS